MLIADAAVTSHIMMAPFEHPVTMMRFDDVIEVVAHVTWYVSSSDVIFSTDECC